MITILLLFTAMLNTGSGGFYQPSSSRSVGSAPAQVHPINNPHTDVKTTLHYLQVNCS